MPLDFRYLDGSCLTHRSVGELFHTCRYPADSETYWLHAAEHQSKIGVQFASKLDYHAAKVGHGLGPFVLDSGLQVCATLASDTSDAGVRERVYTIAVVYTDGGTSAEVARWAFHHLHIDWPNYSVPITSHFDALFTRYVALLKELAVINEEPSASGGAGAEPALLGAGLHVIAHCIGGRGRAGTFVFTRMVTGMLLEDPGITAAEIHTELLLQRRKRDIVENDGQEEFAVAAARRLLHLVTPA